MNVKAKKERFAQQIHEDMTVRASGNNAEAHIGTVKGIKRDLYIKLHKRDTPNTQRRYIPLEWVASVRGKTVRLSKLADAVRLEWLDKAATKRHTTNHKVAHSPK